MKSLPVNLYELNFLLTCEMKLHITLYLLGVVTLPATSSDGTILSTVGVEGERNYLFFPQWNISTMESMIEGYLDEFYGI